MTYFPAPVWNSLKEFFIPPTKPEGRHPCAQALQSELPLPMFVMKCFLDKGKKLWVEHLYYEILQKTFRLRHQPRFYQERSNPRNYAWSEEQRFQMEILHPNPYPYPASFLYSHATTIGVALRIRNLRGFKAITKFEMREHLTNNGIKTTNKMQKRELLRLCLSF